MFSRNNLKGILKQYHLKDDYFIRENKSKLEMDLLPVLKPKNLDEFYEISSFCHAQGINFKLVKGLKSNFSNPGCYDNTFAVDVDLVDSIIDFSADAVVHLPGTTARQVNHYLNSKKDFSHQLSLSQELTDHLLIYNQKQSDEAGLDGSRRLILNEYQTDRRWLIVGLKSFESFYKIHKELGEVKTSLSGLTQSFMIVNRDALLSNSNILNNSRGINSNTIYTSPKLMDFQFFLIIEMFYNKYIFPGIINMLNDLLGTQILLGNRLIDRLKNSYRKPSVLPKPLSYCEALTVVIDNDVNLLLFVFHAIYTVSLASQLKLHLYIDTVSNNKLKIYVKFYYLRSEERKAIVASMLDLTNRIRQRVV